MRSVLDTSVFFDVPALERLQGVAEDVVVPAVAFTERVRQLARAGRDTAAFVRDLDTVGFIVEAYTEEEAFRVPVRVTDDGLWKRHARDAMIAGHVREGDRLWTANPRDFLAVGVDPGQIVDLSATP